jgi:hypothetical protein
LKFKDSKIQEFKDRKMDRGKVEKRIKEID